MELGGVIQSTKSAYHGCLLRVLYKKKMTRTLYKNSNELNAEQAGPRFYLGWGSNSETSEFLPLCQARVFNKAEPALAFILYNSVFVLKKEAQ